MHGKVPVFPMAGRVLGFTFGEAGNLFRVGWLPIVLSVIASLVVSAGGYVLLLAWGGTIEIPTPPGGADLSMEEIFEFYMELFTGRSWSVQLALNIATGIASTLALAGFYVVVQQRIMGSKWPEGPAFFRLGGKEILTVFAYFLISLVVLAIAGTLAFGVFQAGNVLDTAGMTDGLAGLLRAGMIIVGGLLVIYLSIKPMFLYPLIAEGRGLALGTAFGLMQGTYWRVLVAAILVGIVLFLLMIGVALAMGIGVAGISLLLGAVESPVVSALIVGLAAVAGLGAGLFLTCLFQPLPFVFAAEAYRAVTEGGPG